MIEPSDSKGIDYYGNRCNELFIFRRVSFPDFKEREEYQNIIGGSLEFSALSTLKASGQLSFAGGDLPSDSDLVRIYYRFTDSFGDTSTECLATMFFSVGEPIHRDKMLEGTMDCTSTLSLLQMRVYGMPFTIKKGTNALSKAIELIKSFNLPVNSIRDAYTIKSDHTFDASENMLTIVNWLLDAAGYSSLSVDAYGGAVIEKYREPTEMTARYIFRDDEQSIMIPEVHVPNDYQDTPNTARLRHVTKDESLWACAKNVDPMSRASIVSRGYEKTIEQDVSELDGSTRAERISKLKALALKKLIDNSVDVEKITMTICWLPICPNDAIEVEYRAAGLSWTGSVTNVHVDLTPSVPCQLSARTFIRKDLMTTVEGGAL